MHSISIMKFIIPLVSVILSLPLLSCTKDNDDVRKQATQLFGPLPEAMTSEKNPITPAKVKLGKILFFETRISIDGTVSCARCHLFGFYGTDRLKKSIGNNNKTNPRNAPTILNAAAQIAGHCGICQHRCRLN